MQVLGKGLDRSRNGGTRKGEPSLVRASQKTEATKPEETGAVACGPCRSLEEVAPSAETPDAINLKITRGMTTTPIAERNS